MHYWCLAFICWLWTPVFFRILENIALHKCAWQLYPYGNRFREDLWNASNAVDGLKTDLSCAGHQCTHSANNKKEAMWRVDLRAILGIHSITLYYRTDNVPWGRHTYFYLICLLAEYTVKSFTLYKTIIEK